MSLFQKGLAAQATASAFAIRPRPTTPGIRLQLRRVRQPRRHRSAEAPKHETPREGKAASNGSSVNSHAPSRSSESNTSSSLSSASNPAPSPQPGTAAVAAGAVATSSATTAVGRSRGLREVIKASPLGRFGRWYSRVQQESPYKTQLFSSVVIYLFGDLSAQLLFPSETPAPATTNQDDSKASVQLKDEDEKATSRGGSYDPWRTVRHLIVGVGSSIPSYKW